MSKERLVELSERWGAGDHEAAEALFREYAPFLRMVVRRQLTARLRSRFDSHDVVQSVWTDALSRVRSGNPGWAFRDAGSLRAFFLRLTRNRFIDFYRRHRVSLARERPLTDAEKERMAATDDRPSEVAAAGELWARLLELTPPAHHAIVALKSQGAPLAEIADRTGFHPSSVRRILYELESRVAPRPAIGPAPPAPAAAPPALSRRDA